MDLRDRIHFPIPFLQLQLPFQTQNVTLITLMTASSSSILRCFRKSCTMNTFTNKVRHVVMYTVVCYYH